MIEDEHSRSRCRATTKRGRPCGAAAMEGGFCFIHANPGVAAKIGSAGGKMNRHVLQEELPPMPPVESVEDLRRVLAQSIEDTRSRRLHPKFAAALAQLSNAYVRVVDVSEFERRLRALEKAAGKTSGSESPQSSAKHETDKEHGTDKEN